MGQIINTFQNVRYKFKRFRKENIVLKKIKLFLLYAGMVLSAPFAYLDRGVRRLAEKELEQWVVPITFMVVAIGVWRAWHTSPTWEAVLYTMVYGFAGIVFISIVLVGVPSLWLALMFLLDPFANLYDYCNSKKETIGTEFQKDLRRARRIIEEVERERKEKESSSTYDKAYQDGYQCGYQRGSQNQRINNTQSEYQLAKTLFMLDDGFTMEELKHQFRMMQKTFHPDNGDNNKIYTQKINDAYMLLKPYAKK